MISSARYSGRARGLIAGLAWLACLLLPLAANAERTVRVFEVAIRGEASPQTLQEAMRRALVRATGRREAADDPALAGIVAEAQRYVLGVKPGADGVTQIAFDEAAVSQAIASAGRSVWERARPFTIVVLQPMPNGAAGEAARAELERVAEARGLPITVVPLAITDAAGNDLGRDEVLQSAQRLGGDAVLVGRGDSAGLHGQWQWTLYTNFSNESWTGPLEGGIHGAVDALSRVEDASASLMELEALVQVNGVQSLADYAAIGRLLDTLPGVRRASVMEAYGPTVTFNVIVRGGAEAIDQALSGSSRLVRVGFSNGRLVYDYRH